MSFLTFSYLVSGRNQLILLEKLRKSGVNLKKIEIIDSKTLKITIDGKDRLKFFAICKNSWYNRLLKVGGCCSPAYKLLKNLYLFIGIVLFFALTSLANNLYFEAQYQGDSRLYATQIENSFNEVGIKKFLPFSQEQLDKAKLKLESNNKLSFISIVKKGNRAVVYTKQSVLEPSVLNVLHSDYIAQEDMLILKITVYSGRAVVNQGDFVKRGDLIAKASYLIKDNEVACPLVFTMASECTFTYEYVSSYKLDDSAIQNGLVLAKIALGDYELRSCTYAVVSEKSIKITIKYEKTFFGG